MDADKVARADPADENKSELSAAERRASAARQDDENATSEKEQRWTRHSRRAMAIAVAALITGCFAAFGGDLANLITSGTASSSRTPSTRTSAIRGMSAPTAAEDLQAHAYWCCRFTSVLASTGFYWPGSATRLSKALGTPGSGVSSSALIPAGLGVIEIPLQTSSTEPIDVEPPKIVVRSRTPNLTDGIVAILPRGGQGAGSPAEFEADVDDAEPATVTVGSGSKESSTYQYVSSSSPETMTLYVADSNYSCFFDVQITWLEQGRTHTAVLTDGGRHFHILGSAGLPWYRGDPEFRITLRRAFGHPFSYYAPG
jgi:hypothetical protein